MGQQITLSYLLILPRILHSEMGVGILPYKQMRVKLIYQ